MTDQTENDYTVPFSMRLTRAQRRKLGEDAGSQTVGEYVRSRLFENRTPLKRTFRRPVQDEQALTKVLGALGRSRLSSNLNQLAKAVHSGSLPITPETEKAILEACAAIQSMNGELVKALGLPPEVEK
ncbi:MAG: hypothetical protein ACK4PK_08915 [Alphaproteobacteria bacterium]